MSKKLFAAALVLCFAMVAFAEPGVPAGVSTALPVEGGALSAKQAPTAVTGWYWMYDNTETSGPWTGPDALPALAYNWVPVPTQTGATKGAPYNDRPWAYPLEDSFWYYGHWYVPGDEFYLSPDGWASFDARIEINGAPNPPTGVTKLPVTDQPNELFAVLWADYNPLLTADPSDVNRVWRYYNATNTTLYIQWNAIRSVANPSNVYTFEMFIKLGGQLLLDTRGSCGVIYSRHYITYQYQSASPNWTADNGVTGIENGAGDKGIWYQNVGGVLANGRAIRFGYKRIFKHDVQATQFLSPGPMVLRWTEHEPIVIVSNVGTEAEHFPVTLKIYDDEDNSLVYDNNLGAYDLLPGASVTIKGPCWTPGELTIDPYHTYTKKLYTSLATDECKVNDTLVEASWVGCDDTLGYEWNFGDASPGPSNGWVTSQNYGAHVSYPWAGGLVMGLRAYEETGPWAPNWGICKLQMRRPTTGCGQTSMSAGNLLAEFSIPSWTANGPNAGWNDAPGAGMGAWIGTFASPGNVWCTQTPVSSQASWYTGYGMRVYPQPDPCYLGPGPGRGALNFPGWYWGTIDPDGWIGTAWAQYYQPAIEIITHLAMAAKPAPPCYYDEPHDLTCYEMRNPDEEYIEAGVALNPEMAIANIGRQKEPDAGFFPVKFLAYIEDELDYEDSTLINTIGWLGNAGDDPDTLMVALDPWTPKSVCKDYVSEDDGPFVFYDLIGLVRLGEVGPDESDHCPYNDTVKLSLVSLWSHDVGVIDLQFAEDPDSPPDIYNPGSIITATATVENFGYNSENNVPVRLEVRDLDSNGVLLWNNVQQVAFLDWRGNTLDNPFVADVTFPPYTVINDHHQTLEARTELTGDQCPDDDFTVRHINSGIAEEKGLPFALDIAGFGSTKVSFALPYTANVSLKVYDITGKLVATLVDGSQTPGAHTVTWNRTDDAGRTVAQGIYLVRMDAENFSATRKLVLR